LDFKSVQNLEPVRIKQIPVFDISDFVKGLIRSVQSGRRIVQFFGFKGRREMRIIAVLAKDAASRLFLTSARIEEGGRYPSLTTKIPSLHLFERELAEAYNIHPEGHPWLKPVRRRAPGPDYPFFRMTGDEVHEVGVGPVHAGIIEPGHFKFSCHGETVDHLEIALGYQHRGVERLFLNRQDNPNYQLHLAESITGDSVIGHGSAYVQSIEALSGASINARIAMIRAIALELERVGNHLGDLSALSGDVAYLTGQATFGAMRTTAINTSLSLCGSRFGRGLLKTGGVNFDLTPALAVQTKDTIRVLSEQVELAAEVLFNSSSVMARFEKTGIVSRQTASAIGMVGPAARASGLPLDVRADHPFGAYSSFPVHTLCLESGDVFARAYIRYAEIMQSLRIIGDLIGHTDSGPLNVPAGPMKPDTLVVSMVEGWRGEIVHIAVTNSHGRLVQYKIKDPSFHNWFGLALAVRENGISDFPLCNKSFNLSYCGFDL
jgi:Ni,Fe-hydrogenase III large subunit